MKFYNNILHSLYNILKSFEGGFRYQTTSYTAFEVVIIISLFELLNLMSVFSELRGNLIIVPYSILFIINYLVFYFQGRYKKIITSFTTKIIPKAYWWLTILYLLGTIVIFWMTHS